MESPKKLLRSNSDKQKTHKKDFHFPKKRPKSSEIPSNNKKKFPLLLSCIEEDRPLIYAASTNNLERIQHLLSCENVLINEKNDLGVTAFLSAVQNKNKKAIDLFLKNPKTNVSLKNNKNQNALQLLENNNVKTEKLYIKISARIWIETIIDEKIAQESQTKNESDTYESVCQLIKDLREIERNYSKLTNESLLPDYADDNFIKDLVFFRSKENINKY
jgi:ankyrin repeat protein